MRHYVFDESDVVKFKYCPHCGEELYSVYRGDYAGYLECSECDRCEGFYILEEMIFREPKWLINVITAPYEQRINEMNKYKHEQNKRYQEALESLVKQETLGKDIKTGKTAISYNGMIALKGLGIFDDGEYVVYGADEIIESVLEGEE